MVSRVLFAPLPVSFFHFKQMYDSRSSDDDSLVKAGFIKCFSGSLEQYDPLIVGKMESLSHRSTDNRLHANLG
jgi:hypothetical protein